MMNDQYKKMKNLFLRQSYIDAWEDYQRSLRKKSFAQWDYIVLTASNEEQANAFRLHIGRRKKFFHVRQNIWFFQILTEKELALAEQLYRYFANYQKQKILLEIFIKRGF